MAKKKQEKMPKTLYITRQKDGDEVWFNASTSLDDLADKDEVRLVGTYQLVEEGNLQAVTQYEPKKAR